MEKLNYAIGELSICLEMPFRPKITTESEPFLASNGKDPDVLVKLIPVDTLPPMAPDGVWHQDRYYAEESFHIRSGPEKAPYALVKYIDNHQIHVFYLRNSPDMIPESGYLLNMLGLESLFLKQEVLILHASFIRWHDQGILFSAPSGTGKSTQASLWETHMGAEILNGDRAGIRYADGSWMAYGLPYAGSSRIFRNSSAPIRAIVVLRQSPENRIRTMGTIESLKALLPEFSAQRWNPGFMDRLLNVAAGLLRQVPVWCLECRPDRDAVQLLHDTLFTEEIP